MKVTGEELCDYLTWAHYNAVPLKGDATRQAEYQTLVSTTCVASYYNSVTEATVSTSESDQNLVSSGFLKTLSDNVGLALQYGQSAENAPDMPLAFTNYQALTEDILLTIAAQTLQDVDTTAKLPASSSLIFEIGADNIVTGYLNDVQMVPAGCADMTSCTATEF